MDNGKVDRIDEIFELGYPIDEALEQGVQEALLHHKLAGNAICTLRGGKVVWIPPEDIPVEKRNGKIVWIKSRRKPGRKKLRVTNAKKKNTARKSKATKKVRARH